MQGPRDYFFYTVDSNILAQLACALHAAFLIRRLKTGRNVPGRVTVFKYAASCCLALTFTVVVLVLAPCYGAAGYKAMLLSGSMLFHHLLCPAAALLSFILFDAGPRLPRSAVRIALLPTVIYAVVLVSLNAAGLVEGPYPFLRVRAQPWWASILWVCAILGGAYLLALLVRALNGRKAGSPAKI